MQQRYRPFIIEAWARDAGENRLFAALTRAFGRQTDASVTVVEGLLNGQQPADFTPELRGLAANIGAMAALGGGRRFMEVVDEASYAVLAADPALQAAEATAAAARNEGSAHAEQLASQAALVGMQLFLARHIAFAPEGQAA